MSTEQVERDLDYVRGVTARAEATGSPRAIYYLWAVLIAIGLPMVDFAPDVASWYWLVTGPAGGLVSYWLGWRYSSKVGQRSRREAYQYALHWGGVTAAILLALLLGATGALTGTAMGAMILLIAALGWFLAGIYLDRQMLWLGLMLAAGYVAVVFVSGYTWTVVGILVAVALVVAAQSGRGQHA